MNLTNQEGRLFMNIPLLASVALLLPTVMPVKEVLVVSAVSSV
jgi:hypothetical protein